MRISTVLLLCGLTYSARALALDPNKTPGQNFDLSHWTLTLPVDNSGGTNGIAATVSVSQLVTGYTNASYFYTGGDGAMVFCCPATGATTLGSTDPRTELREMLVANDSSVDWTATGLHVLTGQCKVNTVASGGELAIAQIHGFNLNIPVVILRYDNSLNQGTINATVKYNTNGTPVNGHTDNLLTFADVGLNNLINYQIALNNGVISITVNGNTQSQNLYDTDTNWAAANFYFKAGVYYLDNGGTTNSAQASFYSLTTRHQPSFNGFVQSGTHLICNGGGGQSGSTYYALASTNLSQPASSWTPVATNVFDSAGNFLFTNTMTPARQRFFILKLQ